MNLNNSSSFSLSKKSLFFILLFWLSIIFIYKPWQKNLITNDVVSYYGYLPATFIYDDLTLKFVEKNQPFFADKYWPHTSPNGGKVIKMSMGLSILYCPFFFIGHLTAPLFNQPQDGYSLPYQICLLGSCLFYLWLGFYFLRKLLLVYFSEKITSLTIVSLFFGTNLLWYSTFDGLMSHGYLFSIVIIFIYQIVKWHQELIIKNAILIGLLGGLITVIRPTLILCFLFFLFYNVYSRQSLFQKLQLIRNNILSLILIGVCFLLIVSPQLIYWKCITGDWLFFSYVGERFYFNNPHIVDGLLSFRKGWLIYTPIMIFSLLGIFYLRKQLHQFFLPLIITFSISLYVIFSWWCWWYGGSFGQRPLIDFYGFLALPLATFYNHLFSMNKKLISIYLGVLIIMLITLNLFQTWQFKNDLIHYDAMSREAYFKGFFATGNTGEWYESLNDPDYDRARNGLKEQISIEELKQIKPTDKISFTSCSRKSISCEVNASGQLISSRFGIGAWETFSLIYLDKNHIALKADNKKYVCAEKYSSERLFANRDQIGLWETFELIILPNNKIALKADNGKYVSVNKNEPFELFANSDIISKAEEFRIYIN